MGRQTDAAQLKKMYRDLYSKPMPDDLLKLAVVAPIAQVLDNEDKSVALSLRTNQDVRIFAIGEGQAGGMFDYGWIEDVDPRFRPLEQSTARHFGELPSIRNEALHAT